MRLLRGFEFPYFLFVAMGHAERGGGNELAVPAALAISFLSSHMGRT